MQLTCLDNSLKRSSASRYFVTNLAGAICEQIYIQAALRFTTNKLIKYVANPIMMRNYIIFTIFITILPKSSDYTGFMSSRCANQAVEKYTMKIGQVLVLAKYILCI